MIYGQLQDFNDELKVWYQMIQFHKNEVGQLLIRFNMLLSFSVVSACSKNGKFFSGSTNRAGSTVQPHPSSSGPSKSTSEELEHCL